MSIVPIDNRAIMHVLYEALLNRDPDPGGLAHYISRLESGAMTLLDVGLSIVSSNEFFQQEQVRAARRKAGASPKPHPYESWDREALAFIHLHKTGGTTLHSLLAPHFPAQRICPERFEYLHLYSPAQLAEFDFFSGHFDYFSTRFIPRRRVFRVSIFRDPTDRLISWYRFFRAHPLAGEFANDTTIKLAHELTAEEFFEHSHNLRSPFVNNAYLSCFATPAINRATVWGFLDPQAAADPAKARNAGGNGDEVMGVVSQAVERVTNLDAVGLTERFGESVELIFAACQLPIPNRINPQNVTDNLQQHDVRASPVPRVELTARLLRALDQLTRYDRIIYDAARQEFERRLAERRGQSFASMTEAPSGDAMSP